MEQAIDTGYFSKTLAQYKSLRDKLFAGLQKANFNPLLPQSGYFIIANVGHFKVEGDFSTVLTEKVGVTSIPLRAFYNNEEGDSFVRFAFCKDSIDSAIERLLKNPL